MVPRLIFLLSLASPLVAQDGPQLYTLYCSACHGADGKGATGGAFPPLAGSQWVAGDADRSIKIILNGLTGPVDVAGTTYDLEMPPQGAVLSDDQIAAILTHVRSSWGNQEGPVSAGEVKMVRAAVADRTTPWTAPDLLKIHPLPFEQTALRDLTSRVYTGKWKYLPDFTKLTPDSIEEEHDGVMRLGDSPHKEYFGMVWQGTFEAPVDGDYFFRLDADDAAKIIFDGEPTIEVHGIGPMDGSRSQGFKAALTKGPHPIRVEYLQFTDSKGIAVGWRGPGSDEMKWLTEIPDKKPKPREVIMIAPAGERPVIYRNFITGTSPRAIGVGFPGGLNLAWSADHLAPELLWTGNFIDGAPKWLVRGTAENPPAGKNVIELTKFRLLPKDARFKGYRLDPKGNPTFTVQLGEQTLTDSWQVGENRSLVRTLTITGGTESFHFVLSRGGLRKKGSIYNLKDKLFIESSADDTAFYKGTDAINIHPGKPVTLTYRWPNP